MVLRTRNKIQSVHVHDEVPNAGLRAALHDATKEYRRGETVGFNNVSDAIRHLHSLCDAV